MICSATTKAGKPCAANAIHGGELCISHSPRNVQDSVGFGGSQPDAGRPKNPRMVDIMRERMEANSDAWWQVFDDARVATRKLVSHAKGVIAEEPDHPTRMAAAREVLDRGYGRPRQSAEITGSLSIMDLGQLAAEADDSGA